MSDIVKGRGLRGLDRGPGVCIIIIINIKRRIVSELLVEFQPAHYFTSKVLLAQCGICPF